MNVSSELLRFWDFSCIRIEPSLHSTYSPIYEHSITGAHRALLTLRAYEPCARTQVCACACAGRFKAKINNKLQSEWDLWTIRIHFGEIFPVQIIDATAISEFKIIIMQNYLLPKPPPLRVVLCCWKRTGNRCVESCAVKMKIKSFIIKEPNKLWNLVPQCAHLDKYRVLVF